MRNFLAALVAIVFGAFLASCDLQPKISSIPDSVGDFISTRYPAMLADPDTEPEIYNSAVSDYGVYASPELYGTDGTDDYVNYVGVDDYVLKPEPENDVPESAEPEPAPEPKAAQPEKKSVPESKPAPETSNETESEPEPDDVLDIPEYKNETISVPARAVAGTVIVRRGDTLYSIAREHKTTIDELARANNLKSPYTVKIGQTLKLKSEPAPAPVVEKTKAEPAPAKQVDAKKTEPVKKSAETKPEPKKSVEQKPAAKPAEQKSATRATTEKTKDVRVAVKTITVARGDTLYSLSRKYEIPVNDLAVMNNLRAPFALSVGQKLRVPDLPDARPAANTAPSPAKSTAQPKAETKPAKNETKKESTKSTAPTKTTKSVEKTVKKTESKPAQKQTKTEPKKQTQKTEAKTAPTTKTTTPTVPARSSSKFTWPVRGSILSHYGAKSGGLYNDGINISAAAGTSVVAAENGVVAYAGNEVRGMGNLIIIQHADGWMTVYAHLNSMAVRRGARVSVGQKIGTVGKTGKVTTPQLHFEIRKGTKSYNPTNYLKK